MDKIKIFADLFQIRTQAHWLHLLTKSYEEHKTLGDFYSEWELLLDKFIETYFGKYGRVEGTLLNVSKPLGQYTCGLLMVDALSVSKSLKTIITEEDLDLENIIADFIALCNSTKYKLTLV